MGDLYCLLQRQLLQPRGRVLASSTRGTGFDPCRTQTYLRTVTLAPKVNDSLDRNAPGNIPHVSNSQNSGTNSKKRGVYIIGQIYGRLILPCYIASFYSDAVGSLSQVLERTGFDPRRTRTYLRPGTNIWLVLHSISAIFGYYISKFTYSWPAPINRLYICITNIQL